MSDLQLIFSQIRSIYKDLEVEASEFLQERASYLLGLIPELDDRME